MDSCCATTCLLVSWPRLHSFCTIFLRRRSAHAACINYFCASPRPSHAQHRIPMSDLQERLNVVDVIASDAVWTQCDEITLDLLFGRRFEAADVPQTLRVASVLTASRPKETCCGRTRSRAKQDLQMGQISRLEAPRLSLKLQSTANAVAMSVIQRDERRCESFQGFYSCSSETSCRDRPWRALSASVWTSCLILSLNLTAVSAYLWSSWNLFGKTPLSWFQTHATPCSVSDKFQFNVLVFGDQCRSDTVSMMELCLQEGWTKRHRHRRAPPRWCSQKKLRRLTLLWWHLSSQSDQCRKGQVLYDASLCGSSASNASLSLHWWFQSLGERWDFSPSTTPLTLAVPHLSGNPGTFFYLLLQWKHASWVFTWQTWVDLVLHKLEASMDLHVGSGKCRFDLWEAYAYHLKFDLLNVHLIDGIGSPLSIGVVRLLRVACAVEAMISLMQRRIVMSKLTARTRGSNGNTVALTDDTDFFCSVGDKDQFQGLMFLDQRTKRHRLIVAVGSQREFNSLLRSEKIFDYLWSVDVLSCSQSYGVLRKSQITDCVGIKFSQALRDRCGTKSKTQQQVLMSGQKKIIGVQTLGNKSDRWCVGNGCVKSRINLQRRSWCDGRPSFRHFCHLFCVVLFCCERLSQSVFSCSYSIISGACWLSAK